MNGSPQGPAADVSISTVLAAYPLSHPRVVSPFEASTRNDLWLVEDKGNRRYVLTRHRQHRHPGRVEFQLRFQQHLYHNGFPTAEGVETRLGRLLVLTDDGIPWTLSTYITGDPYDFGRIDQVVEAARRLAQSHTTAKSFPGEEVVVEYYRPLRDWWVHADENVRALQESFVGIAVDEEISYLRDRNQWVLSEWPLERFNTLPVGWVHGDYHGRNMVFVGDELRGLFDFDDVTRWPLVYDVARAVYMFGREARGSFRIRPEVARRFVDEYEQYHGLSSEERAAVPMMIAMIFPNDVHYYRYCQWLGEDIEARLRREIRMMRALQAEIQGVREALH
jgi:Ser/Thr protein kinase RdoA (MazF antagonist)